MLSIRVVTRVDQLPHMLWVLWYCQPVHRTQTKMNMQLLLIRVIYMASIYACPVLSSTTHASTALLLGTRNLLAMEHACRREVGTLPTVSYAMHLAVIQNEPWVDTV